MNVSEQTCVQLFSRLQKTRRHIEIRNTLHEKSMFVRRVLVDNSHVFKNLSGTLRFRLVYRRNEWSWIQLYSSNLMVSTNSPKHWDSWHITWELHDSDQTSVHLCRWIEEIISETEIHGTLDKNWLVLRRLLFKYSQDSKKWFHALGFIAYCVGNEWFSPELCSINSVDLKRLWHRFRFIAHYIRDEWFSGVGMQRWRSITA